MLLILVTILPNFPVHRNIYKSFYFCTTYPTTRITLNTDLNNNVPWGCLKTLSEFFHSSSWLLVSPSICCPKPKSNMGFPKRAHTTENAIMASLDSFLLSLSLSKTTWEWRCMLAPHFSVCLSLPFPSSIFHSLMLRGNCLPPLSPEHYSSSSSIFASSVSPSLSLRLKCVCTNSVGVSVSLSLRARIAFGWRKKYVQYVCSESRICSVFEW